MLIDAKRPVPAAAEPGGPPAGTLKSREALAAELVARQGRFARVYIHRYTSAVYGWNPASAIVRPKPRANLFGDMIGDASSGGGEAPKAATCAREVPLSARRGEAREVIGALRAGARVIVAPGDGPYRALTVPAAAWLRLEPGVELVAAAADLAACRDDRAERNP